MCVDLHTHSIYSDGTLTPAELVDMALHNKLRGLALTDHDTVEGVAEIQQLGQQVGLTVLTGLEISTTLRQHTLHILGYGIDPGHRELLQWLLPLQEGRINRNRAILGKLQNLGINISASEVRTLSRCGQTGRPHFARLLIAKGVVESFDAAFRLYLGRNKPAWVRRFSYSAAETIAMIHRAGGIAVLAHPGQLDPEMRVQPSLIRELTLRGLDGLEVYYPTHSKKMRKTLKAVARECGLIATGGSDYHGDTRPLNRLAGTTTAFCPPFSIIEDILACKGGKNLDLNQ
ncbi:PHP domain-containing protein [Desulfobulbus alkaliphilus]|uniref:PHP domain-containing protein n=1 Tax=Desulfobulbus alkaliphilus TaxID=869814 RepID=UPI00196694E5|nr:PHP domain-containing protein [Desulfobulbus alkaliphilus]MBM9537180.1 PHP domain-containing protein [Desulfobulbus alkaliphilus]